MANAPRLIRGVVVPYAGFLLITFPYFRDKTPGEPLAALVAAILLGAMLLLLVRGCIALARRSPGSMHLVRLIAIGLGSLLAWALGSAALRGGPFGLVLLLSAVAGVLAAWFGRGADRRQIMLPASRGFAGGIIGSLVGTGLVTVLLPVVPRMSVAAYAATGIGLETAAVLLLFGFAAFGFAPKPADERA